MIHSGRRGPFASSLAGLGFSRKTRRAHTGATRAHIVTCLGKQAASHQGRRYSRQAEDKGAALSGVALCRVVGMEMAAVARLRPSDRRRSRIGVVVRIVVAIRIRYIVVVVVAAVQW